MASVYDEYERSLTGKWRDKMTPWKWILTAMVAVTLLGGAAVAAVALFAVNTAHEVVVDVMADLDDIDGNVVIEIDDLHEVRNIRDQIRRELREELRHSSRHSARESAERARALAEVARVKAEVARVKGDVKVIHAHEIQAEVMHEVQAALAGLQDLEGAMSFSIDGETVTMDLFGDDTGGVFTVDVGERSYSVRIEGEDEGARLILNTPDGESVFEAGESPQGAPSWVPRFPGSSHPDRVFSGDVAGKTGGADLSVTDDSPLDVVRHFTEALEADGYDVKVERLSLGHNDVQGSIIGTRQSDGRTVAVVVVEEHGETKVLTLWGESTDI
jgi:hypothetical protein